MSSENCVRIVMVENLRFPGPFLCLWHHLLVFSDLPHSRPVCFTFTTMSHPSPIQLPGWNLDALIIAVGLDRDEFFHREVTFASMSSGAGLTGHILVKASAQHLRCAQTEIEVIEP